MPFGIFLRRILADAGNTASAVVASAKEDPYKEVVKKSCGWPTQAEIEADKAETIAKLPSWSAVESEKAINAEVLRAKQARETAAMDTTKCYHGKVFGSGYNSHNFSSCNKGCPALRAEACRKKHYGLRSAKASAAMPAKKEDEVCLHGMVFGRDHMQKPNKDVCNNKCAFGTWEKCKSKYTAAQTKEAAAPVAMPAKKVVDGTCPHGSTFGVDHVSSYVSGDHKCKKCDLRYPCVSAHQKLVDSTGVAKCEQGLTFGMSFGASICSKKCPGYIYEACNKATKKRVENTTSCEHGRVFGVDWTAAPGSTCYSKCHWKCSEACRDEKMKNRPSGEPAVKEKKGAKYIKLFKSSQSPIEVTFFTVEQSHHVDAFGKTNRYFIASDGYKLASAGMPGHYDEGVVYLQGGNEGSRKRRLTVSVAEFARIEKAVAEYNEYFKDSVNPDKPLPYPPPAEKKEPVTVGEGWIPKVGDKVEGLKEASRLYCETTYQWQGKVVSADGPGWMWVKARSGADEDEYEVETKYFQKVI